MCMIILWAFAFSLPFEQLNIFEFFWRGQVNTIFLFTIRRNLQRQSLVSFSFFLSCYDLTLNLGGFYRLTVLLIKLAKKACDALSLAADTLTVLLHSFFDNLRLNLCTFIQGHPCDICNRVIVAELSLYVDHGLQLSDTAYFSHWCLSLVYSSESG